MDHTGTGPGDRWPLRSLGLSLAVLVRAFAWNARWYFLFVSHWARPKDAKWSQRDKENDQKHEQNVSVDVFCLFPTSPPYRSFVPLCKQRDLVGIIQKDIQVRFTQDSPGDKQDVQTAHVVHLTGNNSISAKLPYARLELQPPGKLGY